jgi:hypothetical protein
MVEQIEQLEAAGSGIAFLAAGAWLLFLGMA